MNVHLLAIFIKRLIKIVFLIFLTLLTLEICGQVIYRIKENEWLFKTPLPAYFTLFRTHPYLVAEPIPNAKFISKTGIKFEHTKFGFRGENFTSLEKKEGLKRIAIFGGSTVYCVGVSNNQTWPYYLGNDLKDKFEVINLGVPGYNTVEHVIQTALNISDISPDICIYYIGWNDIRNIHIANLRSDYSDFHGRSQYDNLCLGVPKIGAHSIIVNVALITLENLFVKNHYGKYKIESTIDRFTPKIEKRALDLYKRNIRLIILLAKAQGAKVIMVPQILNYEKLTSERVCGWIPYLSDKDVQVVMRAYNNALQEVCVQENTEFIEDVLNGNFSKEDFIDEGHFSSQGNKKFADIIAKYINKNS